MQHAQQPEQDPMLSVALAYSQQGWPVFPVRSGEEYDEDTGEIYGAKTPLISNGLRGATLTERIVREFWKRNPGAAIGVPTGSKVDAWVLDVDNKPGGANGFDWLHEMEAEHGPLPHTKRVTTPNGGLHIFFRYVAGTRNRGAMGAGVDVRSEGGYVVAAGSVMADGRAYAWEDESAPIAEAPAWLLELVLPRHVETPADYRPYTGGNSVYVDRAVDGELSELASTPHGGRNNKLNDAAFALGQFVGAGALSEGEARDQLEAIASQWPNFPLSRRTITNGLTAGMRSPRIIPEAPADNDNTKLVDIKKMLERAREKAAKKAAKEADVVPAKVDIRPDSVQVTGHNEPAIVADAPPPTEDDTPFRFTPFTWKDPKTLPRREFAFGKHYIRKYVSVTVAPGGLGKTSNSVVEALSMASGKDLTGDKPPKRLKVWLFNAEDPRDEMDRRIMAACLHYGLSLADIEGHLFLDTGREQELIVMHEDKKTGVTVNVPIVEAVAEQIRRNQVDVLIVDPFVSTHRVNENDNGAIDKVAKLWAQIADDTNCAIDVVHHLRKLADREATVEDARGAISLIGAARSVRVLNRMSAEDANSAGIDEKDRYSYFHIHYGKQNLTRMDTAQHWRKMESVSLGNGPNKLTPGDTAGVVTEWKWPSQEELMEGVPDDVQERFLIRINNQEHRDSDQAEGWAGYLLAELMGEPLTHTKGMTKQKRRFKRIIDAWKSTGLVTVDRSGKQAVLRGSDDHL